MLTHEIEELHEWYYELVDKIEAKIKERDDNLVKTLSERLYKAEKTVARQEVMIQLLKDENNGLRESVYSTVKNYLEKAGVLDGQGTDVGVCECSGECCCESTEGESNGTETTQD